MKTQSTITVLVDGKSSKMSNFLDMLETRINKFPIRTIIDKVFYDFVKFWETIEAGEISDAFEGFLDHMSQEIDSFYLPFYLIYNGKDTYKPLKKVLQQDDMKIYKLLIYHATVEGRNFMIIRIRDNITIFENPYLCEEYVKRHLSFFNYSDFEA